MEWDRAAGKPRACSARGDRDEVSVRQLQDLCHLLCACGGHNHFRHRRKLIFRSLIVGVSFKFFLVQDDI